MIQDVLKWPQIILCIDECPIMAENVLKFHKIKRKCLKMWHFKYPKMSKIGDFMRMSRNLIFLFSIRKDTIFRTSGTIITAATLTLVLTRLQAGRGATRPTPKCAGSFAEWSNAKMKSKAILVAKSTGIKCDAESLKIAPAGDQKRQNQAGWISMDIFHRYCFLVKVHTVTKNHQASAQKSKTCRSSKTSANYGRNWRRSW